MNSPTWTQSVLGLVATMTLCVSVDAATSEPGKKNILFIAVDDLRPWLGCYGHPQVQTPHLDALAASGVRFDNAHAQFALCMPSRTSVLSGCRPDEAGRQFYLGQTGRRPETNPRDVSIRSLRNDVVSLPEHLRRCGWRTISLGKIGHDWDPLSFDELRYGPGEPRYYELPETLTRLEDPTLKLPPRGIPFEAGNLPDERYNDAETATDSVRTLAALKATGRPFFLGVGFWRPHLPLICPKKYWDLYPAASVALPTNPRPPTSVGPLARFSGPTRVNWDYYRLPEDVEGNLSEAAMRETIRGYLACITFVDVQIGRILSALQTKGLEDDTIVVVWSDHGHHLGEHAEWTKLTLYEESTRVPLIIRDPGSSHAGRAVTDPVELLDLYPTLCELAGADVPRHVEGESLGPLLRGETGRKKNYAVSLLAKQSIFFVARPGTATGWSIRTADYRYTAWWEDLAEPPVQRELFDHQADPGENRNLVDDPAHATTLRTLHDRLLNEVVLPQRAALARRRTAESLPTRK